MQATALQLQQTSVIRKVSLNYLDPVANSNKYYVLELHRETNGGFTVYFEYGRVGKSSQSGEKSFTSRYAAESFFETKMREKLNKGYVEVDLAQSSVGTEEAKSLIDTTAIKVDAAPTVTHKSNLEPAIQKLVIQIYDEASRKLNTLVKGNTSADGASPLGKLSPFQIEKGRRILRDIAGIINTGNRREILSLSTEYYRQIPKSFGSKVTESAVIIDTTARLSEEMDILKFYEDSLRMGAVMFETDNVDKRYEALHSDIGILLPSDPEYKRIVDYVVNTQSHYHSVNLNVKQIFTINQKKAPALTTKVGNVKQLFHGSRSANLIGILSSHLKLPNQLKGVYITGAMFGPGIYFADQSTKSSQYSCCTFGGSSNKYRTSFMFLADVALGKVKEEENAHYYHEAPKGYDSVKGVKGRSLLHNEYIIYKEDQQQIRYLIEFEGRKR